MAKRKFKSVEDFIEIIVGKNERIDLIGENEWDRIDDEIIRARKMKEITSKQMIRFRKQLRKLKRSIS